MSFFGNNSLLASSASEFKYNYDPNNLTLVFDTSKEPANNTVSILLNGSINCTVYWGDGTSNTYISSSGWKTHTYANPGIYIAQVQGTMTNFSMTTGPANQNNKLKLVGCLSFGNSIQVMQNAFSNCTNLIRCPSNLPTSLTNPNINSCFSSCTFFNDYRVVNWDMSKITSANGFFNGCINFNQPVGSWDVSKMFSVDSMFGNCPKFNQPLNSWDVSNFIYMGSLFAGASSFNQPLNSWNVSKAAAMNFVFQNATSFSQDISLWNIKRVTSMQNFITNAWGSTNYSAALNSWANIPDVDTSSVYTITNISSFSAGQTQITVNAPNDSYFINGRIRISGTANYNGDYNVASASSVGTIVINVPFVGNQGGTVTRLRPRSVALGVSTNKYNSTASAARQALISNYQWSITDGGASGV